jgi:FemAB-related protein (PEP-CTERM system-associated)
MLVLEGSRQPGVDSLAISRSAPAAAWDAYVASHADATGYHRSIWRGVFERALGHETVYVAAMRGSQVAGVLPLVAVKSWLFGSALVSLPFLNYGGVLADDDAAANLLVDAARAAAAERGLRYVELRHIKRVFRTLAVRDHKVAMTLALPADDAAAWKALDNKVRNQVRKAQKSGLQAASGGAELLGEFYDVFSRNMRDLGTPVFPRALFEQVLTTVDRTRAYVVRSGDKPIAAGITVGFRGTTENIWASSLREFRAQCPNMLLYWTMIEDAVRAGQRTFDFGRSTPGEGTYHFKKQWGAVETPYAWEYAFPGQNGSNAHTTDGATSLPSGSASAKVELATRMWKHLPLPVANALGPAIARSCSFL